MSVDCLKNATVLTIARILAKAAYNVYNISQVSSLFIFFKKVIHEMLENDLCK